MNLISPLIKRESIIAASTFASKKKLFEHAAQVFAEVGGLKKQDVFDSLFERERLGSTALGAGVAIPHGRIKGLDEAIGAFYRIEPGMEFESPDGQPVNLCFVLLVPQDANEHHLQILGELAQLFGDEAMRKQMQTAPPDALYDLLTAWTA